MAASLSPAELARHIEHPLHRADASAGDIEKLCAEAGQHAFFSVSVNGSRVELARHCLEDSKVKVTAVVGFPLGAMASDVKRFETEAAADEGAHEIDMVLNLGRIKDADFKSVLREIHDLVEAADGRPLGLILETALLTREEIVRACQLAVEAGARAVVTSTGFVSHGATVADVKLIRETVGPKFGVKLCGEIRDASTTLALIEAGATRLCTSQGAAIVAGLEDLPK